MDNEIHPIIEGLIILAKYYPYDEFGVTNDMIYYAPYEPNKISAEDLARLNELKWKEEEDSWCHFA